MAKPKTIRWMEALSAQDIARLKAYIANPLFSCRKETVQFVAQWSPKMQWADWDRPALGKIQADLKKFLAVLAFAETLHSGGNTNLYAMRGIRSRIRKQGKFVQKGFEWEDYDHEMNAFRNKAEKEGMHLELFQAESEYLTSKLEGGKKVPQYSQLASQRDKSLDLWYLSTRLRNLCVTLINHEATRTERQLTESIIKEAKSLLEATQLPSLRKKPLLKFYAEFWEYLTNYFKTRTHSQEQMRPLLAMLTHNKVAIDPIANALIYSLVLTSVNRGDPELTVPFYQMIKNGLVAGHFRDVAGKIPFPYYRAVTLAGIMAGKTTEIEKLLPVWKDEIGGTNEKKDALFKHCKAQILLSKGKYAQAWDTCQNIKFTSASQRWYHAELRFRIQYEADGMGKPIRQIETGTWVDTREEELKEMKKMIAQISSAPVKHQSLTIWANKTKGYELLDEPGLTDSERKKRMKALLAQQKMTMHDWAWFAKALKTEAGFLRPLG